MRTPFFTALFLISTISLLAQNAEPPKTPLPKDPRAVFATAAPFYNFADPALKPWHLKASYQLYDEKGQTSEQGTYEYWWASPKVNRSTWTRPHASHTDWHTVDGNHFVQSMGDSIKYFEYRLQSELFAPLPDSTDLDPTKFRLERELRSLGPEKSLCIMVVPIMPQHGRIQSVPIGLFPTYCFDPDSPALRVNFSFGTVTTAFDRIVQAQNKFIPREITFFEGKRKILTAKVEGITFLGPSDPALTPPATATNMTILKVERVPLDSAVAQGFLIRKPQVIYPQDAKDARVSGKVVLHAVIGTDGGIHELHVLSTPWPSLTASALSAVSQWEYKPYKLNGEPVEVETTIEVIYTLGN